MTKQRVLILCTGNSARSQMGEGLLRHMAGDKFDVFSAGTRPAGLNRNAVEAMREIGIDISRQRSKSVDEFAGQQFDYVITVCDNAKESCPIFPGAGRHIHQSFEDPAAVLEQQGAAFRKIRDELQAWLSQFVRGGPISAEPRPPATEVLNAQREHWEETFASKPGMFGEDASYPARVCADLLRNERKIKLLELGGGQGRDSLFFVKSGFDLTVVDYSEHGLAQLREKSARLNLARTITTVCHDVRKPLPFETGTFDAVFSHMLYCMALTTAELISLSEDIRRVLKLGGLNVFTVRTTEDAHYGTGIPRGDDMCEVGGFIVHFFDKKKVAEVSNGYDRVRLEEFEEGGLPRKLFLVALRKPV